MIRARMPIAAVTTVAQPQTTTAPKLARREITGFQPTSKKVKVAFFDADSTLRVSKSGSVSANSEKDVQLLPFAAKKLKALAAQGYLIAIVSNQGGVGKSITLATADKALQYTKDLIRLGGGEVHYFDFAEFKDHDRKPDIGMGERLESVIKAQLGAGYSMDKARSFMVGDSSYTDKQTRPDGRKGFSFSDSDRLFAANYGIPFHEPQTFFGWDKYGVEEFERKADVDAFWKKFKP